MVQSLGISLWEAQDLSFQTGSENSFLFLADRKILISRKWKVFFETSCLRVLEEQMQLAPLGREGFLSCTFTYICGVQMFTETYGIDRTPGLIGAYGV